MPKPGSKASSVSRRVGSVVPGVMTPVHAGQFKTKPLGLPRIGVRPGAANTLPGIQTIGMGARATRTGLPVQPAKTINQSPGRRSLSAAAKRGKKTAAIVAAGALGVNAIMSNSGRATDRTVGRPTGMFGY